MSTRTTMTEESGIRPVLCRMNDGPPSPSPGWGFSESRERAWRIKIDDKTVSLPFARKIDAEAAVAALLANGIVDTATAKAAGPEVFLETACGALQW